MPKSVRIFNERRLSSLIIKLLALLGIFYYQAGFSQETRANSHIRILLDTSKSMIGWPGTPATDPDKLSVLSALMFFDLIRNEQLNISKGDTFKVLPFDYNYTTEQKVRGSLEFRKASTANSHWNQSDTLPRPISRADLITFTRAMEKGKGNGRQEFFERIKNLPRDSRATYFYPGLIRLIQDIKNESNAPSSDQDIKTIILVTDGIADGNADKATYPEIAEELANNNIDLIILGFGKAHQHLNELRPLTTFNGKQTGLIQSTDDTNQVMRVMMELFAQNYHYSYGNQIVSPGGTIKLSKQAQKTITVATHVGQNQIKYELKNAGRSTNSSDQIRATNVKADGTNRISASYQMREHDSIKNAHYTANIRTQNISQLNISVLKPASFNVKLTDPSTDSSGTEVTKVIAGLNNLPAYIYSDALLGGTPENDFILEYHGSYVIDGEQIFMKPSVDTATFNVYKTDAIHKLSSQNPTASKLANRLGKLFEIPPFEDIGVYYKAELDTFMRHVKSLPNRPSAMHKVHSLGVYPNINLHPSEPLVIGKSRVLEEGDAGCSKPIKLRDQNNNLGRVLDSIATTNGVLSVPLYVYLSTNDPNLLDVNTGLSSGLINGAIFKLNGKKIGFSQQEAARFTGKSLDTLAKLLTGPSENGYQLCIKMGIPISQSIVRTATTINDLSLQFVIDIDPYSNIASYSNNAAEAPIKQADITLRVAPSDWSPWSLVAFLLLPIIGVWFLRYVPTLEPDLRFNLSKGENSISELSTLESATPLQIILRLRAKHAMLDPESGKQLGTLRPTKRGLYEIIFNSNYSLVDNTTQDQKSHFLDVGHSYLINTPRNQRYISLHYLRTNLGEDLIAALDG